MNYLIESILVGIYATVLYFILNSFNLNYTVLLFLLGFLKHFLGYYLGIQSVYCGFYKQGSKAVSNFILVLLESTLEGILFIVLGTLLKTKININIIPFVISLTLHIIFEITGVHSFFLKNRCKDG
jgi:hypothetical protein